MKKIFITPILHNSGIYRENNYIVLDPQDTNKVAEEFSEDKISEIEVWGLTQSKNFQPGTILSVIDHINCTGNNPLRNHRHLFDVTFPDLTNIYKKNENGIITTGWGSNFPIHQDETLPTKYFCYYGIIAGALGLPPIHGFLINS